ncbi:hypothetical protein GHT06_015730 [Daphnia sinensis]|uniref:Glutathione peroxidase n=1 Tax=Daphnia sinensis TaxID=1820382 RepID=A0AAD5LA51_9CRUS|nr:hypothetical protein GHT06_015730 [Daphnia sinensis]
MVAAAAQKMNVLLFMFVLWNGQTLAEEDPLETTSSLGQPCNCTDTIFRFSERALNSEKTIRLSTFRNRDRQKYHELNALQEELFRELAILAFPCNQFGKQEPGGSDLEILNGIRYVRPGDNFQPKMTLFQKTDVNGANQHPLFAYLKSCCPPTREYFEESTKLYYTPIRNSDIRWNFEKFLVDRKGIPVMRYDAMARVADMRTDIDALVNF